MNPFSKNKIPKNGFLKHEILKASGSARLLLVGFIALASLAWWLVPGGAGAGSGIAAGAGGDEGSGSWSLDLGGKSPGRTASVARDTLVQRVTIAGAAESVRNTLVTVPYDGYVNKLFVKLGQQVQAGDPIMSIAQSLQADESVFPIRAPFTGTVTQVMKHEGQFARQADLKDYVLRIDDLRKMFIHANAPEIDVGKIEPGHETEIKISAVLSKNYKGIVREISQAATLREQWGGRAQVDYLVKIEILDADSRVKPGMSAIVDIITDKKENVLTLAHEFLQNDDKGHFVTMKDGSRRRVKLGLGNESAFEITEGLSEGEEVRQIDFLELVESK